MIGTGRDRNLFEFCDGVDEFISAERLSQLAEMYPLGWDVVDFADDWHSITIGGRYAVGRMVGGSVGDLDGFGDTVDQAIEHAWQLYTDREREFLD